MQVRRILLALLLTALLMFPIILVSRPFAATIEPRRTGAPFPGEGSCAKSGCHDSNPANFGAGGVSVLINGGPASEFRYAPGETASLTVRVADPAAFRWGFQLSTRPPDGCSQAGSLAPANNDVAIITDTDTFAPCAQSTIDFAVHNTAKFGPNEATFLVNWTAPSSDIGPIVFAAAGNAANGNNQRFGDNIYTTQETVQPTEGGGGGPTIAAAGIVDAAQFQPVLSRGGIGSIFGSNLADGIAGASDTPLPTELAGVRVEINGVLAPLFFVSPNQFNFQIRIPTLVSILLTIGWPRTPLFMRVGKHSRR